MKILISADLHNGIPGKLQDTTWCMDIIRQYAKKNNIKHIIILGDLFHDRVNISIDVLNAVYQELKKSKQDGQQWYSFCGNHDMYLKNSWEINSLKPFESVLSVTSDIETIEIEGNRFQIIPFMHYETEYMKALKKTCENYQKGDILLTHIGIHGATLNECFLLKNWNIVEFNETPYDIIYSGHFHCYQKVNKAIYPGSPIPFRFDEGLVDHGFIIHNTKTRTHEFIKIYEIYKEFSDYHPPDYLTITDIDLPEHMDMIKKNNVKIILTKDYTKNELDEIRNVTTKGGANQIKWTLPQKKIEEITEAKADMSNIEDSESLFKFWLKHDQPKLKEEILLKLHQQIARKAEERIVIKEEDE